SRRQGPALRREGDGERRACRAPGRGRRDEPAAGRSQVRPRRRRRSRAGCERWRTRSAATAAAAEDAADMNQIFAPTLATPRATTTSQPGTAAPLIELVDITKTFSRGAVEVQALRGVSLTI